MEKYIQILSSLNGDQKIDFLERILHNSKELQAQFIHYFTNDQQDNVWMPIDFNIMVIEEARSYQAILEALDLEEPDYDRWHNRSDRYYEDWELAQEAVEEEVNELFDTFKDELLKQISQGDIAGMMAKLTGLLIACYEADVDDPCDNLGDPQGYFVTCLWSIAKALEPEINKTILNNTSTANTIKEVLRCFANGEANKFFPEIHDAIMVVLLKNNPESCLPVYDEFCTLAVCKQLFPNSYIETTRMAKPDKWIAEAEKFCMVNVGVAKDLLEYLSKNDKVGFHRNARIVFPLFQRELVELIANEMDDQFDPDLAKKVLLYKINSSHQIADYKRLVVLFSANEKQEYIESLRGIFSHEFYIQVLEEEEMYDQILEFARTIDSWLPKYPDIMRSIINRFPTTCLQIVKPRLQNLLEINLGRHYYEYAAQTLSFLASAEENRTMVRDLVLELCVLYPRRSALKEELKKAGLMSN